MALVRGCRCAMSWCNLDLTFDLLIVTMNFKILSGFIEYRRLTFGMDIGYGVGVDHGVTFNCVLWPVFTCHI